MFTVISHIPPPTGATDTASPDYAPVNSISFDKYLSDNVSGEISFTSSTTIFASAF